MTTRRYFLFTTCLFALAAVLGAFIASGPHVAALRPGRHLVLPTRPLDMGFIAPDSVAHFHFVVRNAGTIPLKIKKVFANCGCTVAMIDKKILRPGASALVSVAFHSTGYWRGVRKEIYFVSDDSERPFQQVALFGYVHVGTRLDAKSVRLGTGEFGQRLRPRVIHVLADAGASGGTVRIAGDCRGLIVKTGPWRIIDGGEAQRCSLRVSSGPLESPPGDYSRRVIIAVGSKIKLPLSVLYTVRPMVSCEPSEVSLSGKNNTSATATLCYSGHHVRIDSISSAFGYCKETVMGAISDGAALRITRRSSGGKKEGDALDVLRVRYDFDGGNRTETLDIPVVLSR